LLTDPEIATLVQRLGVAPPKTGGVLLVDDEKLNLRVLRGFLDDRWTVHEATSGAEALEVAARVPLDVVVADQRMPGMTGVELLEELRRRRPDVAGIVLTAFADMQALESAINRASVFRFMRKPWDPAEIIGVIEQATAYVVQRRTIEQLVSMLAERSEKLRVSLDELKSQQQMMLHLERLGTIGKLTTGVTHDLRNLMVAFRAAEWEMQSSTVPDGLREIVTLGLAGVENMLRTLGTLHEFARTGAMTLDLRPTDPGAVVGDAIAIARMDPAFKLHAVACEVPEGLPAVRGDRQKLTQVVVNLVRNALAATKPNEAVRVEAEARGDDVVMSVEDEGPGVPASVRARLFQPFASTKGDEGLGLGLYMARLIVESHGGRLDLLDRPRGARFEVVIPTKGNGATGAR
jgi:two-component system sensor histidine kinase/response regulator